MEGEHPSLWHLVNGCQLSCFVLFLCYFPISPSVKHRTSLEWLSPLCAKLLCKRQICMNAPWSPKLRNCPICGSSSRSDRSGWPSISTHTLSTTLELTATRLESSTARAAEVHRLLVIQNFMSTHRMLLATTLTIRYTPLIRSSSQI